jgi:hypothetical protein
MARRKHQKSFVEMSDAQKTQAVKEFDRPLPASRLRPLTTKQRLLWERARAQKPDVSIYVRQGKADVVIHLDADLLAQARVFAQRKKTSLAKMIDRGLRGLLAFGA